MQQGVIAAGHQAAADAGRDILINGGNAFDAAVGAALVSYVAEPSLVSAGGGGFLLATPLEGPSRLFDFFVQTPSAKRALDQVEFFPIDLDFGDAVQTFHIGMGSAGVPGIPAGLWEVHRQLGHMPLAEVVQPALRAAREGVSLSAFQTECLHLLDPIMRNDEACRRVFGDAGGKALQQGAALKMPRYADTIDYLARHGIREFYEGEIAGATAALSDAVGGHLRRRDFAAYRVEVREPLRVNYRGYDVLTNPLPSSGGSLMAFSLAMMNRAEPGGFAWGTPAWLHWMAEIMWLTNAARRKAFDPHIYRPGLIDEFLADRHILSYLEQHPLRTDRWGNTSHLSVYDKEGNAAAMTSSVGQGCGHLIPGTDIMLNNMLGEEDLNPRGFHSWEPDRRISSMMAPTVVLGENGPRLITGSGGANRIRTALLQIVSNVLDAGMDIRHAVEAPRLHLEGMLLDVEAGFDPAMLEGLPDNLRFEVKAWKEKSLYFGGAHSIGVRPDGSVEAAADLRRHGAVAGY